jgi:DNA-directed RNA polymerase II subunit RPB1
MGIVQDSLTGATLMTNRDTFIEKDAAMLLAMWLPDNIQKTLPVPAIIKPIPLWTGKQIFSMLIPELNLERIRNRKSNYCCPKDSNVLIERGEMISGVLNK